MTIPSVAKVLLDFLSFFVLYCCRLWRHIPLHSRTWGRWYCWERWWGGNQRCCWRPYVPYKFPNAFLIICRCHSIIHPWMQIMQVLHFQQNQFMLRYPYNPRKRYARAQIILLLYQILICCTLRSYAWWHLSFHLQGQRNLSLHGCFYFLWIHCSCWGIWPRLVHSNNLLNRLALPKLIQRHH